MVGISKEMVSVITQRTMLYDKARSESRSQRRVLGPATLAQISIPSLQSTKSKKAEIRLACFCFSCSARYCQIELIFEAIKIPVYFIIYLFANYFNTILERRVMNFVQHRTPHPAGSERDCKNLKTNAGVSNFPPTKNQTS